MRAAFFIPLLCGLCLQAQVRELATTDSGDQLYFTSLLGVRGVDSLTTSKILRWSATDGMQIVAQRANQGNLGQGLSNPYQLSYPNVTGDGTLVTFTGMRDCYVTFKFGCLIPNPPQTTILGGGQEAHDDGRYQLSRNGKFALRLLLTSEFTYTLLDLDAGTSADLPHAISVADRGALTSDGRVVFGLGGALHLWSPAGDRQFDTGVNVNTPVISADGRFILFQANTTLYSLSTDSGSAVVLPGGGRAPSISADGTFLTFLAPVDGLTGLQLFVARPDGSDVWQITSGPEGVREAVISGDGGIVFLVSESNRILRYDVNTGDMQELSPRVAYVFQDYFVGARGSMITIRGSGLSDGVGQATYPLTTTLADARVEVSGMPLLLVSAEPGRILAQVPFEMSSGKKILNVASPDGPLTAPGTPGVLADFLPSWPGNSSNGFALHTDLTSNITLADPARPGEVIHFILSGLGDVTPPLPSGVPAPAQPELRVARPFRCILRGSRGEAIDMEVVKAILIPGTLGIYRVSVLVPPASLLPPDVNGYFFGSIAFEPGDPLVGVFQTSFGQVPIKP